jgi:hypothetical protein
LAGDAIAYSTDILERRSLEGGLSQKKQKQKHRFGGDVL